MMMMIMVIGAIFESEDDFSNGESETDSTDNAGGVPRGVGRGRGRGRGREGDRPSPDSHPRWTKSHCRVQ